MDNLNTGWTQSFGYDGLNRLTSAFRSDGGYNHTYHYDSFGNISVTDNLHSNPVWGVDPATNQLLQNPVAGVTDGYGHPLNNYTYDYAGNMVSSGSFPVGHAYQYNALNQINCVDCGNGGANPTAVYTYNGDDERVYKQTATDWSQYVYFNGQVMGEQTSAGTWSDYIYANGQKIAKVNSQRAVFHVQGYRDGSDTSCGEEGPLNGASPGIVGMTVAAGDQLVFDLQQNLPMNGGLGLIFTDGTGSGAVVDTNGTGQPLYFDGEADGLWHHMVGDLSPYAGEVVAYPLFGTHDWAPFGNFSVNLANAAVVHSNGSVTPIYTGQQASVSAFTGTTCGGQNMTNGTVLLPISDPTMNVSYFVDDHLGTAQMELSGGGWPMWQGQFTPFGLELPDGSTDMEFKFTGKERDTESGLDFFGARYYASSMGRWMSPDDGSDWNPGNPQSLNLYSYGHNNPLSLVDPDGHTPIPAQSAQIANAIAQDRTLHAVFNAANNFSPRGFENAFNSGALNNLGSAQGNTLRGLAGEAQVIDDINGSLLQNIFGGTRDRAMVGSAGPSLPGAVPDVFVQYQNVGLANGPATTLQNVATVAGIGDVSIPGSVTMNFLEVKSGISASSIGTGVDQAIATAGAINSAGLGGSAISTLVVDAGAWGSLSAARQASYVGRMSAAGAYIQVEPGLADAAKQRAQNMVDRAKQN